MTWHPDMPEEYKNSIVTGDARELAQRIPDESRERVLNTQPPLFVLEPEQMELGIPT